MKARYYLKINNMDESEVTLEEYCKAERQAGFRPKLPSTDPAYMTTPATGGFSSGSISGNIKYGDEPMGMFKLTPMDPIDLNKYLKDSTGSINPFHTDSYCMGKQVSKDIFMMFDFHDTAPFRYAYFINVKTGERQGIELTK